MTVNFELHREDDLLILDDQDIYKFFDENNPKHQDIAYYLKKWMEFLNYPLLHNTEMAFADGYYAHLEGWIDGMSYALHIDISKLGTVNIIKYGRYTVIMPEPFALGGEER